MSDKMFSESELLEDVLHNPDEDLAPAGPATIKTGVGKSIAVDKAPVEDHVRPNARRWMFNPYAVIDLMNKPASCGLPFLRNGIFNEVKTIYMNVPESSHDKIPYMKGDPHDPNRYQKVARTAYMIGRELEEHYGDKGVVIIEEVTGEGDDVAGNLNHLLFGDEIACVADPNYGDDHPCPVLPTLLENLAENYRANIGNLGADTKPVVINAARRIRGSIAKAMQNAQALIDIAQGRLLDEKNPNRTLSIAEQRCYLALGQEIPNQLPFVTRSAAAGFNQQNQAIDYEAIGRGVAAGMAQSQAAAVGVPAVVPQASAIDSIFGDGNSFEVTEEDIEVVDTPKGKKK